MEYTVATGKKQKFYIGPSNLNSSKRLEIDFSEFNYPEFTRTENFEKEICKRISKFFNDKEKIVLHITIDSQSVLHKILLDNKKEFDEFDRE